MFGSSNQKVIDSKRAHRDSVIATALAYDPSIHDVFINASGILHCSGVL
jgi:hypothetical protein